MRESGRAEQITATIIETARQCNLDKDVALPADDEGVKALSIDERDLIIGNVYRWVDGFSWFVRVGSFCTARAVARSSLFLSPCGCSHKRLQHHGDSSRRL